MGGVPQHLRDASYKGAGRLGHGKGYRYPHDHPGDRVDQVYMPEGFEGRRYWEPEERLKLEPGDSHIKDSDINDSDIRDADISDSDED